MAERIVDEIYQQATQQARYPMHVNSWFEGFDQTSASLAEHRLELGDRLAHELIERNRLFRDRLARRLDRRECEQVLGQSTEPLALLDGVDEARRRRGTGLAEQHLEMGA